VETLGIKYIINENQMKHINFLFKVPVLLIFVSTIFNACDPLDFCTEPRCQYSDVYAEIPVNFSGNLHPIIHIGDTIRLYMKIPDTLETNYGDLKFGTLWTNSFFGIRGAGVDEFAIGESINPHALNPTKIIKYGTMPNGYITWDYKTREYECIYVPSETGKYVIDAASSARIEMTATDDQSWLVNGILSFDCPKRYEQFNSWIPNGLTSDEYLQITQKKAWYCFEVVE
jgi:hypothetical protein